MKKIRGVASTQERSVGPGPGLRNRRTSTSLVDTIALSSHRDSSPRYLPDYLDYS